ncbi:MAG: hypothetical protein KIT83_04190 [Bryobacterales bacterium]|nr:hypothetical protein [Bryobacterales bacterium]
MTAYFKQLEPTGAGYRVSRELETEVGEFSSESDRSRYLHSFAEMADRGLFTFDIDTYEREGLAYFLVAEPMEPIVVDALPREIQNILERTQLKDFRFGKDVHIPYQVTLGR